MLVEGVEEAGAELVSALAHLDRDYRHIFVVAVVVVVAIVPADGVYRVYRKGRVAVLQ